jgi:hypothetical protein
MEMLKHCTQPVVEMVLADVARVCAPDGRVIISVPIEIGPSFLVKQSVRPSHGVGAPAAISCTRPTRRARR